MTDSRPTTTFFFPYYDVSGVPVLFSRMARHLAERGAMKVRVIDYPKGYQSRVLAGVPGIELVPFEDGRPVTVGPDEHLVMQSILPATIRPELRPAAETPLFFWTLHPLNLVQTIIPADWGRDLQARHPAWNRRVLDVAMRKHRNAMRELVRSMHARGALAFMDGTTLESTTARLGIELDDPTMLPVSVDMAAGRRRYGLRSAEGTLEVGWLGRLSDFKVHILAYTIRRLSAWAAKTRVRVTMHVVGDGPEAGFIRALAVEHDCFRMVLIGAMLGQSLDDYLVDQLDLLVAMGTSALEGARLGIPTVLLDVSYGPLRGDYRFRWLFEAERFSLADVVGPHSFSPGNRSLETMLTELRANYASLSDRTYRYCLANHALPTVAARFEELAPRSEFCWGDLSPEVRRKSATRRAYEWWRGRKAGRAAVSR